MFITNWLVGLMVSTAIIVVCANLFYGLFVPSHKVTVDNEYRIEAPISPNIVENGVIPNVQGEFLPGKNCQTFNVKYALDEQLSGDDVVLPLFVKNNRDGRNYFLELRPNYIYFGGCNLCGYGGALKKTQAHNFKGEATITAQLINRQTIFPTLSYGSGHAYWILYLDGTQVASFHHTPNAIDIGSITLANLRFKPSVPFKLLSINELPGCPNQNQIASSLEN